MIAFVTGMRPFIDIEFPGRLTFDVIYSGAPLDHQQQSSITVDFAAGDTPNTIAPKLNAAVDAEGRRLTTGLPGGALAPTTTFAPSYIKLR